MKNKTKARIVDHVEYGLYIWQLPSGNYLGDEHGNYLLIPSQRGDIVRMNKLRQAANNIGFAEGAPVFMAGHRKVTDDEYDDQMQRMINGDLPDEYDVGALKDDLEREKKYGR